jgi:hypothetical protein
LWVTFVDETFFHDVVANGQPSAGKATTDFAPISRSLMAAIAFFSAASFDLSVTGRTSTGVIGACA